MGLILDTNVFMERSGKLADFSQWERYGDVYISAITASELLVGVHYADNGTMTRSEPAAPLLSRLCWQGYPC